MGGLFLTKALLAEGRRLELRCLDDLAKELDGTVNRLA